MRHCIVCTKPFTPVRKTQIFCPTRGNLKSGYACNNALHLAELAVTDIWSVWMQKNNRHCFSCKKPASATFAVNRLILNPGDISTKPIEAWNVVGSCRECRNYTYTQHSQL